MSTPDEAWSVSRLARAIKRQVEDGMEPVWVRGELVGVKRYPSGHWYFGLRDEAAKVDCTLWKGVASRLAAPLEEGQEVFALGTANVWEERTALRFNVTRIVTAAGIGAAAQAFERTKQALLKDGLLDPARKRPLPPFPLRIAVITSIAGAAVHDIITVATRRWPGVELFVVNSAVQGDAAPAELVAALRTVARLESIDCCIIGRGGGAREDLAAFNDEALCRAIAACPVPVISAVGHEVDVTLADLVADLRAATPSQAAEFALPDRQAVQARLLSLGSALLGQGMSHVTAAQERLVRTRERMGSALLEQLRGTERRLLQLEGTLPRALERHARIPRERLARLEARLAPAMERRVARDRARLGRLAGQLDALSPLAVLGRGYAMARDADGRLLRRRADFPSGTRFTLTVADGEVAARTEDA